MHNSLEKFSGKRIPRYFEYEFALDNLQEGRILDIGISDPAFYSGIPKSNEVTVLDILPLKDSHKGLDIAFLQKDARDVKRLKLKKFNSILFLSTLEHIFLPLTQSKNNIPVYGGAYVDQKRLEGMTIEELTKPPMDKKAVLPENYSAKEAARKQLELLLQYKKLLRKTGNLILTLPYGAPVEKPTFCLYYTKEEVNEIKDNFTVIKEEYITKKKRWVKCQENELACFPTRDSLLAVPKGIVLLSLENK